MLCNLNLEEDMDCWIRLASVQDLDDLLLLLPQLTSRAGEMPDRPRARDILSQLVCAPSIHLIVAGEEGSSKVCGTAIMVIVPNLTYGGRSWAIIENVVVEQGSRRTKIGTRLMQHLRRIARDNNCYKVQWISGDKPVPLAFYRSLGSKTEGHVAHRIYF